MKGWYGDSHRHSLASRGIKTTDHRDIKQYKQVPRIELVNELENDLESLYACGIMSKLKSAYSGIKKSYTATKKSYKQTKAQAKNVGKAFTGIAKMGIKDAGQMFKEMGDSASLLQLKDTPATPSVVKTTLKNETVKIDNDIKTLDGKIRERRKEIRAEESQDKKDFREWYDVEKDAYELSKDSVYSSGMDDKDKDYELRKQEIEFKANIEQNKHLLNSNRGVNDADIEHMRDLQSDLKRLRREIKKKVNSG